ncbi:MAG: pectinesterase family protein [Candidatus Coproplasma sp.]
MNFLNLSPKDDLQYILDNLTQPTTIYLAEGVYTQKLWIKSDDVILIGASRETTKITYADYAKKPHKDGREYNTFRTYTVCVTGERCRLENLTVENSNVDPKAVGQCVALSVNARSFRAQGVDLISTQDTLFTSPFPDDLVIRYSGLTDDETYYDGFIPREQLYLEGNAVHIFKDCKIFGSVDYIFGCAEAYFDGCKLISIADNRNMGFVAAPAHSLKQDRGYTFLNCEFIGGGAPEKSVFLARPWRDFGKCDFIDCTMGSHISPELFDKWNDTYRDKTCRMAYRNLSCNFAPAPVPWSRELTQEEAKKILDRYAELCKQI